MPRKHSRPHHQPYQYASPAAKKTRYDSRRQAEAAAQRIMDERGSTTSISVYRDIDGGWYLTSINSALPYAQ